MTVDHPYVCFFPALPLANSLALGEWRVGTPPTGIHWRSDRFKELVEALLGSFASDGFKEPAVTWHEQRGMSGERSSDEVLEALQAAVRFSSLDANDQITPDLNAAHYLATTENAVLYVQPIDEKEGWITHRGGGTLKSVLSGGWRIGERPLPLPDAVVPIDRPCAASGKVAGAIFGALTNETKTHPHIRIALEWHSVAMSNPRAITLQQRLVAVKTGFEALSGKSKSRECARSIRTLFETAASAHIGLFPWAGILWSPNERTDLNRPFTRKGKVENDTRSEFEDWFMTLAAARNSVIHDGALSATEYAPPPERPHSRYTGNLFWRGERLLREAIKASLGGEVLLCGRLAEMARCERVAEMIRAAIASEQAETSPNKRPAAEEGTRQDPKTEASRSLEALLAALKCTSANRVVITKSSGAVSASERGVGDGPSDARLVGREGWRC